MENGTKSNRMKPPKQHSEVPVQGLFWPWIAYLDDPEVYCEAALQKNNGKKIFKR